MVTFLKVVHTLSHWLCYSQNDKAVSITIECENDTAFFNTYTNWRHEIASLQHMTMPPENDIPTKKIGGQLQFSFVMMGHNITFKSKEVHVEPYRQIYRRGLMDNF